MSLGIGIGISPVLLSYSGEIEFLLRDDFISTESAPITSPRTAEPGPGTLDIFDSDNSISISSGQLVWTQWATDRNGFASATTWPRAAGLALMAQITHTGGGQFHFGFDQGQQPNPPSSVGIQVRCQGAGVVMRFVSDGAGNSNMVDTWPASDVEHQVFVILRSAGGFFISYASGAAKLLAVRNTGTSDNLYAFLSNFTSTVIDSDGKANAFRVSQLSTPWDTDNGIATSTLLGSRSTGDTFVHEADCLLAYTVDALPTTTDIQVSFRRQDFENRWFVSITAAGSIVLYERVANSATNRGSASMVVSAGDRIVIVADDETINVYADNVLRIAYSSAANFKTETDGVFEANATNGAISDIIAWPRTLSGAALTALNNVVNA